MYFLYIYFVSYSLKLDVILCKNKPQFARDVYYVAHKQWVASYGFLLITNNIGIK